MCKVEVTLYTCKHSHKHTCSLCRGLIKQAPDSNISACRKGTSLYTHAPHKCGPCSRNDAQDEVYREMGFTREQDLTEAQRTELDERLAEAICNIPTTNWRAPAPLVYGRRPSQSRSVTRRRGSLLRFEVKAEDIGGPEAWESDTVPASGDFVPVYETVCGGGWESDWWPSETRSLAEEIAEDAAARGTESEVDQDQDEEDQSEEAQEESEEDEAFDGELGLHEGDDLLLLAQQTLLPLDLDDKYYDHHTERGLSLPTAAANTPAQPDIISADGTHTTLEATLDINPSESVTQLPVLGSDFQPAESPLKCSNRLPSQSSRVMNPYGPSSLLGGDTKVRYWHRRHKEHKFDSPEGKPEIACWELASVSLV
jgi:hypothetical protein